MADIDKALPNEPRKTVNVPGEEEIQEQIVEEIQTSQEEPGPDGNTTITSGLTGGSATSFTGG